MTNRADRLILKLSAAHMIMATHTGTLLAACNFSVQGKGRVTSIIDARTFRLDDGREVRLAGIETDAGEKLAAGSRKLETLIGGRAVTLRASDDKPDRYGREVAVVFPAGSETSIQTELLSQGEALASGTISDKDCSSEWTAAENSAREARGGFGAMFRPQKTRKCPAIFWRGWGSLPSLKEQFCRRGRPGRYFTSISDGDGHGTLP